MRVTKAVILAAGRGTRFLPFTKACPKEMIPVVDTPSLQLIVDEVVEAGITDILIVNSRQKASIEKHFARDLEMEKFFVSKGKNEEAEILKNISTKAKITFAYQENPKGSGDAVLCAEKFAEGQPIAVLNGDDAMFTDGGRTVIGQLIDCFESVNTTVVGVQPVAKSAISKYGAIEIVGQKERTYKICSIIEKPKAEEAPSLIAALGRYVISADFFDFIRKTEIAKNGELQFTDSINLQAKQQGIFAFDFEGKRYDLGDKFGFVKATVEYALRRDDFGKEFAEYLKMLAKRI